MLSMLFTSMFVFCFVMGSYKCSEVVVLDTSNFEKLTQASTGHTTGDWFVKFYAPWCGHCKTLAPILDEVAQELKGVINVAKVDVMQSRDLGTRFDIKGFPTLKFFSKGKIYTYKGDRSVESLVAYAKGGFESSQPEDVPKEMGYFGDIMKTFQKAYVDAANDAAAGNYFTANVFLMALPIIFGLIFFLLIITPGAPQEVRKAAPKKTAAAAVASKED